ncbi:MAG: uracil-DNA glycosylase [Firmicutes bacterium]|nr:uracil-DNA glycosylase [Bacillota bacterium]
MARILRNDWAEKLDDQFEMPYYKALRQFLIHEYRTTTVYPDMYDIFNALHYTPYAATKVCILGQDPYHGPGQAHGLSFSVKPGVPAPPSLQNIFKELKNDLGCPIPNHGCLEKWAREGVLLLNAVLTVRRGQPNSHAGKGWEHFTNRVVEVLNEREDPVVFILWGRNAQAKKSMIDADRHFIIESAHPSPLSAHYGFFGSRPFSRANRFLQQIGKEPVDWALENIALPSSSSGM